MNIIGIETATERLGAALIAGEEVYERHIDSRSSHCELLTGFIADLVKEAGITMNDIYGVSVSVGPGSFTGLRIGIATAMGLAYGLGIKTAGINTLSALAWNAADKGKLVCPLIDAKRSEVYTGIYRTGNYIPHSFIAPAAMSVDKLALKLLSLDEPVTITGPAAEQFRDTIEKVVGSSTVFIAADEAKPSALAIARLGQLMLRSGKGIHPSALQPVYLRRSDAEIARDSSG